MVDGVGASDVVDGDAAVAADAVVGDDAIDVADADADAAESAADAAGAVAKAPVDIVVDAGDGTFDPPPLFCVLLGRGVKNKV